MQNSSDLGHFQMKFVDLNKKKLKKIETLIVLGSKKFSFKKNNLNYL